MSELGKRLNELRDIGFANEEQIRSQCLSIIDLIDNRQKPDYYTSIAQRHQQLITGSSVGQLEAVIQDVLAVAFSGQR